MGVFDRIFKRDRQIDVSADLVEILNSGYHVTREQALSIPAVAGCVELIGNTVAGLRIALYRDSENGVEEVTDDDRVRMLNGDTGDLLSASQLKKAVTMDYLLEGNGYIYINRKRGKNTVQSLNYVKQSAVSVQTNVDPIFKAASILCNGKMYHEFDFVKVLNNTTDGVRGSGVMSTSALLILTTYASLVLEYTTLKGGGNKRGFLTSTKRLTEESMAALRESFARMYSTTDAPVVVLNEGLKFEPASNTYSDLQIAELKRQNGEEICRLFNMGFEVLTGQADSERYYNGLRNAVSPVLRAIEAALNRDLLLETEKVSGLRFGFDDRELTRGDLLKRYQAYQIALNSHFMQPDEIRKREDMPALGMNQILLGLNDVLYDPEKDVIFTPNTGVKTSLKGGVTDGEA